MSSGAASPPSAKTLLTAASSSSSSAPVVAMAVNNGKFRQPASENNNNSNTSINNNNMVEISIDTSSHFVDIRQQDSGSNQSGSDSGLGYTNSISSDNSSFTIATGQDQAISKQGINSNSNITTTTTTNNNNNSLLKHNNPSPSIITQAPKEIELSAIDETRTSSIEPDKIQSPRSGIKSDHAPQLQFKSDDEPGRRQQDATHRTNELVTTIQPCAPVIKSLLKKSSQLNAAKTNTNQPKKHSRNVSFNQTVIVFCEETELPSSADQFDPPVGYQDSKSSFEQPSEDYCDRENDRIEKNSVDVNDNEASSVTFSRVLKNNSAPNINDDQLFGLLDNDSLIESFKINCEDFSEDDFPINYLNSSHSYLCNDAISDYDSDSESSLCVERDRQTNVLPSATKLAQRIERDGPADVKQTIKSQEKLVLPPSNGANHVHLSTNLNHPRDEQPSLRSTKSPGNQKSMPARMKVSTVDSSHSKRNLSRKDDANSKPNLKLSQSNGANQSQPERKIADEQLDVARLTPIVVKQSTVESVSTSKPIIVKNNFGNPEQSSDINRAFNLESTIVASSSQSQMASEQHSLMKECNIKSETVVTQSSKLQNFNQPNSNMNQMPPSQQINQPACQICRVIESNRSQTNPEQKSVSRQGIQSIKPLNSNNVEQDFDQVQPNQIQSVKPSDNQPVVFNQSCVSCREALSKQQQTNQENAGIRTTAQPIRSVTYQLVYVVDQKGNRVRALSVRPAFNAPIASLQQAALAGRRILIAQNGQRFRNPISFTDQMNNLQKNPQVTAHPQWDQNLVSNNSTQQYRIIGTAQPQINQQAQHQMELQTQQASFMSVPPNQKVPSESSSIRSHTVYYVRQPLDTQNIRQSHDVTRSNHRSFPDPHEIRRLDGLRGPTSAMSLSRGEYSNEPRALNHPNTGLDESMRRNEFSREDADDPTFGFSKRPSVKVVATSSSYSPSGNITAQSFASTNATIIDHNHERCLNSSDVSTLKRCTANQPVSVRPISLVVMGSQTLDRRSVSSQQGRGIKEIIPSTSSMSNIHGTFTGAGIPTSKVSNMSPNQQQQRISNFQLNNSNTDKSTPKETKTNKSGTCGNIVNNKGEMVTNNRVAHILLSQVQETRPGMKF